MSALELSVVSSQQIGQGMQRLVLQGNGLNSKRIPEDCAGLHIKLFFKTNEQATLTLPQMIDGKIVWPEKSLKPIARTYSIAGFDLQTNTLSVDFVLHKAPGIACDFARNAKPGDLLGFSGPGPVRLANTDCEKYLLVGDLSAVPALSAVAKQLNSAERTHIVIELHDMTLADDLTQHYFEGFEKNLRFVTQTFSAAEPLIEPIEALDIEQDAAAWSVTLAGEHSTVVTLRKRFRALNFPKSRLYAVPYWRYTMNEETYHEERHHVMDN